MPRLEGLAALLGPDGEVAEWSIAPHSKCGIRATVSGVRIPPSPPLPFEIVELFDAVPFRPPDRAPDEHGFPEQITGALSTTSDFGRQHGQMRSVQCIYGSRPTSRDADGDFLAEAAIEDAQR